jgi:hypothetical protein
VSYNQPVVEPQGRPATVTAAAYMLIGVAVLLVANAIISFATLSTVIDATKKAYAGIKNADQMTTAAQAAGVGFAIFYVVVAAGFVVLALFNMRGANPARIVTWVLGGLAVLCFGCGLAGTAASSALTTGSNQTVNGVDMAAAAKQVKDALPSWLQPTQLSIGIINLLLVILVIILLALPASNAFFRKNRGGPGTPDPGFPTLPYPQQ